MCFMICLVIRICVASAGIVVSASLVMVTIVTGVIVVIATRS